MTSPLILHALALAVSWGDGEGLRGTLARPESPSLPAPGADKENARTASAEARTMKTRSSAKRQRARPKSGLPLPKNASTERGQGARKILQVCTRAGVGARRPPAPPTRGGKQPIPTRCALPLPLHARALTRGTAAAETRRG